MTIGTVDFSSLVPVSPRKGCFLVERNADAVKPASPFKRTRLVCRSGGVMLRVSLGASGLAAFLDSPEFLAAREPMFVAVGTAADDPLERDSYFAAAARLFAAAKDGSAAPFGILLDFSSELSGSYDENVEEIVRHARTFSALGIPVGLRLSVLMPPDLSAQILNDPAFDALFVSPRVPWESLSSEAKTLFFRRTASPFPNAPGGGQVQGKYIGPLAAEWVRQLRRQGMRKPVVAGGVLGPVEIDALREAGVTALCRDDVAAVLRPWNRGRIIRKARKLFK